MWKKYTLQIQLIQFQHAGRIKTRIKTKSRNKDQLIWSQLIIVREDVICNVKKHTSTIVAPSQPQLELIQKIWWIKRLNAAVKEDAHVHTRDCKPSFTKTRKLGNPEFFFTKWENWCSAACNEVSGFEF